MERARNAGLTGQFLSMCGGSLCRWLGREGSNLRMAVPKTAALPLGDAPTQAKLPEWMGKL